MILPDGYITGLDRNDQHLVAHIYKGPYSNPEGPMCARGWNRANGHGFSIFRNNVGDAGVCNVCLRRLLAGKPSVPPRDRKTRWL